MRFDRVTIAGVGLIGGSLALAARRAGWFGEIVGLGRTQANLDVALARGIVDRAGTDPIEAVRGSDLIVLAAPVGSLASLVKSMAPALEPGAIVIDVGSVKEAVLREVEPCLPAGVAFVGTHPIAGTESSGAAAADADLFAGHRCILTPGERATMPARARIRALWESVGMQVEEMDAARHDAILAWVSHLPHVLAFGVEAALSRVDPSAAAWAGPSFGSLTRVAASAPSTWSDIFLANADAVDAAVGEFAAALEQFRALLARHDAAELKTWLAAARQIHVDRERTAGPSDAAAGGGSVE